MPEWIQLALAGIGGGMVTATASIGVQWLRSGSARHSTDRTIDAKLQEHWTATTLALVETLRSQLAAAMAELASLPGIVSRAAYLEEALDHLSALLAARGSDNPAELIAAERRAEAFMRRMRGADRKGEERQEVQREISKTRIIRDVKDGKTVD